MLTPQVYAEDVLLQSPESSRLVGAHPGLR